MTLRTFVLMHMGALVAGTALIWWGVYPDMPEAAIGDGLIAGSLATLGEALAMHFTNPNT